jgi:hypothetical protein
MIHQHLLLLYQSFVQIVVEKMLLSDALCAKRSVIAMQRVRSKIGNFTSEFAQNL